MEKKRLGGTDLHTAPVVFGGNVFGWTIDEQQSHKILDEFFDLGFNAIDTADVYSSWAKGNRGGESEEIIGRWMKDRGNRDQTLVITKVGWDMGEGHNNSKDYILKMVEESLARLQTDYIDLYLTHIDDEKTEVEETLEAYDKLIDSGKVRWIGASNLSPERLTASLHASKSKGLPKYEVFQPEHNLYKRRKFEEGTMPICEEHGLGVITYFSLASGFLSGKYRSADDLGKGPRGGIVKKYLNDRGMRILRALDEMSEKHSSTHAAIALAWLIAKPGVTAPIASATKSEHLHSFTEAVRINLSNEDVAMLDEASAY